MNRLRRENMPLVRISHAPGKPAHHVAAMSAGVHKALVDTFDVPADDRFQVVTEHAPGTQLVAPAEFLGIAHSDDMVFVQITCSEGRSVDQKKALFAGIVDNIATGAEVRREDVIINVVETKRENWSFGNGTAPFTK
jgi:4-oxalocrotonate tautomerase